LRAFRAFEMWDEFLGCLEDHAILKHAEGEVDLAVRLAATTAVARERLRLARAPRSEQRWQQQLAALREATSSEAFDAQWSEGRGWQIDRAMRSALSKLSESVAA
jgi:hypothetical protein